MRRIELMHQKIEAQNYVQRKQIFGDPVAQAQPQRTQPPQSPQALPRVDTYHSHHSHNKLDTRHNVHNLHHNSLHLLILERNILDCRNDDDAQNAPYNTLIAYHAVRVFRKDGKFNFYMPPASSDQINARPRYLCLRTR